ncbi:MAG: tetratricopeptide repeat protein [Tannerella sp.]|nr:tetratricopeptide repeat protein [Tannerella sp.]
MKVGYKIIIGITIGLLCSNAVSGQKEERKQVRQGNKSYKSEKFTESEIAYRKSLEVNPRSTEGLFNLGNALYRQEKYPEAAEQYQLIAAQKERLLSENPANTDRLAQVFHNLGNIGMKNKEYAKSVEAYKQSLRMNPKDDETRYNLALAQKLLEDQQNQEQDQDQDQNEDNQQEDQQQDQNQNEEQNQDQQQDDQKEDKTQEEQQQNEQMSQDNAQQILDAFLQDEKDTQEKVKQAQAKQQERRKTDKQW